MIVYDRGQVQSHVVLGHADLLGNFHNLNFDVDLGELFRQRIDLDQTGIHGAIESAKFGDQSDVTLRNRFVRIRADNAAGNGSEESDG